MDLRIIRFCTKVLQHEPEYLGLELSQDGWVSTTKLLIGFETKGLVCEKKDLIDAIKKHPDRNIEISGDKNRVRYAGEPAMTL